MRLLHLSDTHLHSAGAPTHYPELDPAARLSTVLAASRIHEPFDAIALTGDICDDGSRAGAEAVRDLVATAYPGVVVVAAPGNHDRSDVIEAVFGQPPSRLGVWRLAVAATNVPGQVEGDAAGVLATLTEVDVLDPTPLVLLQHHPLFSRSSHEWFVLCGGAELAARLAEFVAPVVVLTGHTHEAFERREGGVLHLGGPSTYYPIRHDGPSWTKVEHGTGAHVLDLADDGSAKVTPVWA